MKTTRFTIMVLALIGMFISMQAFSQEDGDYRSAFSGNWSDPGIWEVFDGTNWDAATDAPDGSEHITIWDTDSVFVDVAITISGYVKVEDEGRLEADEGTLVFADGSTYEHFRDEGSVPTATWEEGSTFYITGSVFSAPANRGQDYYNLVFETDSLLSNLNMDLAGRTISGDITVVSTGVARWYFLGGDSDTVTVLGDVFVEDGQFAPQGTGSATHVVVNHYGDINVTDGNFSISRGSQGAGSGTTVWYLFDGDFVMSDATTQNSNSGDAGGYAKFVFAKADTQQIAHTNVNYGGGRFNLDVSDSTVLVVAGEELIVDGDFVNYGDVVVDDGSQLTMDNGGVYEHARDGGDIPTATWADGSTALFTGTEGNAPGNRGQDYYNLTLNTPNLSSNLNLSMSGNTIGGNIHVINTGGSRWQFFGGSSDTVTVMGDVIMESGQFTTQGTGSATDVVVHHYGNIIATGGNFSISRGSQASGTGTTTWYLYEGDFMMDSTATQNSNPTKGNAKFVFASGDVQTLTLGPDNNLQNFPVQVSDGTTLDIGNSIFDGGDIFWLDDGTTLALADTAGVDGAFGELVDTLVVLEDGTSYIYNGVEPQNTGELLPATIQNLTIDNPAGVVLSQETTINGVLRLVAGVFDNTIPFALGPEGSVSFEGGSLAVPLPDYPFVWDFEDQELGDWYAISDDAQYSSTAEITDDQAYEGTYSVRLTAGDDNPNAALVNDNQPVQEGDILTFWVYVPADQIDDINGLQPFYQINGWSWNDGWYGSADIPTDEWFEIQIEVTQEVTSTERIGIQITGHDDEGTATIYVDNISLEEAPLPIPQPPHAIGDVLNYNGSFALSELGFTVAEPGWSLNGAGFGVTFEIIEDAEADENQALRVDFREHDGSGQPYEVEIVAEPFYPAEGDVIVSTVWLKADNDERVADIYIGLPGSGGWQRKPDWNMEVRAELTTEWQEFTFPAYEVQADDEEHSMRFGIELNFPENDGAVIYLDNGRVVKDDAVSVDSERGIVEEFRLEQNYPNPFNPTTQIQFSLPEQTEVVLEVFDILGRRVATLIDNENFSVGHHTVSWDATNQIGQSISSGVYIYRIEAGDFIQSMRMMFIK